MKKMMITALAASALVFVGCDSDEGLDNTETYESTELDTPVEAPVGDVEVIDTEEEAGLANTEDDTLIDTENSEMGDTERRPASVNDDTVVEDPMRDPVGTEPMETEPVEVEQDETGSGMDM